MQPENSRPDTARVEQHPTPTPMGPERGAPLPALDSRLERGQERVEQVAEAGARASDAAMSVASAPVITPPVAPVQASPPDPPSSTATPLVAADQDLIEKEWVDRAKEIIDQTKDDPHVRTKKVNELKNDYLQKRYGKVVGANE